MEFFHNPQIDWMGKNKYFITLSVILLIIGIVSIIARRGLQYGVDFRGGTMVYVKFAHAPNLDAIRHALNQENLKSPKLQPYGTSSEHQFIVSLDLQSTAHYNAIDKGKADIIDALNKLYGKKAAGRLDFDTASSDQIATHLLSDDPLGLAAKGAGNASTTYNSLAAAAVNFRNESPHLGVISSWQDLTAVPGVTPPVISALRKSFYLSGFSIFNSQIVGPQVGSKLRQQALYVVLAGLAAMLVYVWFRFELIFGVAAVIATFHDVLITLGIFTLLDKSMSLTVIAAFLTLIGYSMNDTIVTFDRIRENMHLNRRENFRDLINRSINQVLSRTILTSGLTFLAVVALYLFGGQVLNGFSLVLLIGVLIGTYSSFAIASPLVLVWESHARKAVAGSGKTVAKAPAASGGGRPKTRGREAAGARR
jgi:preprotein translocase subunit SecF